MTFDQCKRCNYRLQYLPATGEEVKCPRCGMVHVVMENGMLRRL